MFKRVLILVAAAASIFSGGCWYGTFMGPRCHSVGKVRIRPCANFPAYLNSHDRDKDNQQRGPDGVTQGLGSSQLKGMVTFGAGPRFEIGLQGHYYSVGIHAKWWAVMRPESKKKGMDFAPILWLDYIFETQRIAPKLSLVGGVPISRISQAYIGYEGFYGPDMTLIDDVYAGRIKFRDIPQEEYQDNMFLGVDFDWQDFGFTAEIGYPINRNEKDRSTTILFGLGLWYAQALNAIL